MTARMLDAIGRLGENLPQILRGKRGISHTIGVLVAGHRGEDPTCRILKARRRGGERSGTE